MLFLDGWDFCLFSPPVHEFLHVAREQYETLNTMFSKMKTLYKDVGDFYTFDIKKKAFEEFFHDINVFMKEYDVSLCGPVPCLEKMKSLFKDIRDFYTFDIKRRLLRNSLAISIYSWRNMM